MAPTEILAQQHYFNLKEMLGSQGIETVFLTGGQRTAERRSAAEAIRNGGAQVVVGTHAVFGDEVRFARMGEKIPSYKATEGTRGYKHLHVTWITRVLSKRIHRLHKSYM